MQSMWDCLFFISIPAFYALDMHVLGSFSLKRLLLAATIYGAKLALMKNVCKWWYRLTEGICVCGW